VAPVVPAVFAKVKIPGTLQPVAALVLDFYITVVLSWILRTERTGFKHTDNLIQRLTVYSINRGLVSFLWQVGHLVAYTAASPDVSYWAIFHIPESSIYINCALAMLNARNYIRNNGRSYTPQCGFSIQDIALDEIHIEDVHSVPRGEQSQVW